jgi:hypothetical protein
MHIRGTIVMSCKWTGFLKDLDRWNDQATKKELLLRSRSYLSSQASFFVQINSASLLDSLYNFIKRGNPSLEINPVTIVNNATIHLHSLDRSRTSLTLLSVEYPCVAAPRTGDTVCCVLDSSGTPKKRGEVFPLSALSQAHKLTKQMMGDE